MRKADTNIGQFVLDSIETGTFIGDAHDVKIIDAGASVHVDVLGMDRRNWVSYFSGMLMTNPDATIEELDIDLREASETFEELADHIADRFVETMPDRFSNRDEALLLFENERPLELVIAAENDLATIEHQAKEIAEAFKGHWIG